MVASWRLWGITWLQHAAQLETLAISYDSFANHAAQWKLNLETYGGEGGAPCLRTLRVLYAPKRLATDEEGIPFAELGPDQTVRLVYETS